MRFSLGLLFTAGLLGASHDDRPLMEIQAPGVFGSMSRAVYPARATAVEIFSQSGIRLAWRLPPADARCRREPYHAVIVVAYSWETPESLHPGALAITDFSATQGPSRVDAAPSGQRHSSSGNTLTQSGHGALPFTLISSPRPRFLTVDSFVS